MANFDEMKGRVKEAAGDLKGDEGMRQEGQQDQAAGKMKEKVQQGADKVNEKIDDLRDRNR